MSKRSTISNALKVFVAERAAGRCEYCGVHQSHIEYPFHIDHIISLKHGGDSTPKNLAYTCPDCNYNKGADIGTFLNPSERDFVPLFHPRLDRWEDHFEENDGSIIPRTPVGEVTVRLLLLNTIERIILRRAIATVPER